MTKKKLDANKAIKSEAIVTPPQPPSSLNEMLPLFKGCEVRLGVQGWRHSDAPSRLLGEEPHGCDEFNFGLCRIEDIDDISVTVSIRYSPSLVNLAPLRGMFLHDTGDGPPETHLVLKRGCIDALRHHGLKLAR
jgi:hypothetical protein